MKFANTKQTALESDTGLSKNSIIIARVYCFNQQRKTFCYRIDKKKYCENDFIGSIVEVYFGKKNLYGIVLSVENIKVNDGFVIFDDEKLDVKKIKYVNEIQYKNILSEKILEFLKKMAFYNCIDIERLIQLSIPSYWLNKKRAVKPVLIEKNNINKKQIKLTTEQQCIADKIYEKQIKDGFNVSLLRGAMGSGKTYIFLEIVNKIINKQPNSQVLIMVPEIALTTQLVKTIKELCGIEPIIWHSSIRTAKKKRYYEDIIYGDAKIIISTRSGLLLPYKNLKAIIIDEEHDQSYKQDEIPCYNARDMAILRTKYENIPVILSSATPSIETLVNVLQKKYDIYNINTQFFNITAPNVILVDEITCGNNGYISDIARQAIIETKQKGEQTMVFINRRGYSRTLKCKNCGYEAMCENCDNLLTYHKRKNELKCHYCGFTSQKTDICERCGCNKLEPNKGVGVEQLQQEINDFADKNKIELNTLLFSSDEINNEEDIEKITDKINNEDVDIIIGTQIMTKGHHFPRLTTIIVLDIDGMALDGDFRSYEKMFQMLYQLSGRAGRERDGAKIFIQTINQQNQVLQHIKNHDIEAFYKQEIQQRKKFNLPPFSRYISIIISGEDKELTAKIVNQVETILRKNLSKIPNVSILGATECQIHFLKRNYRFRFLIKTPKKSETLTILNSIKPQFNISKKVLVKIDVDPFSFV